MKEAWIDIIVVGGGASGLMAAISAAKEGAKVVVLEHMDVPAKKILATGNGRCNYTNTVQGKQFYRSDSPDFVMPSLTKFSEKDATAFFHNLGVMTVEKNGYCYPRTLQASIVRNALLKELERLQVTVKCDVGIRKIEKGRDGFVFDTKSGTFKSKSVILATGGKADPKSGSDGSGYIYAKSFGHTVTPTTPALVPLIGNADWLKATKGVRQEASVTLYINNENVTADKGEVQFTDYGLSGIPVFQISRFATMALSRKESVQVVIDFVPDVSFDGLKDWIQAQIDKYQMTGTIVSVLSGIVNQKIADVMGPKLPFANQPFAKLSAKQRQMLIEKCIELLKETVVPITDCKSYAQAQVTAGGISTLEIHPDTMESKLVPGLFFAGEIIDVDGMCGGYNLQWAWSSGNVAGKFAAIYSRNQRS